MRLARTTTLGAVVATACLVGAPVAAAHQTLVNNGVAVTLHVNPNDEPVAGEPADISILRISTRKGTFSWATCSCTMTIFEPGSTPLFDGKAVPKTQFTFPDPVAYGVTVKGRVRRAKRWAKFTVTFGLRADPRPASG
ncbi:MAG TPA: hypothetical protein VFA56_03160 [Gaiellaceae bacterium]|nr:hypothetical protein [Gaiellaceae bacterium]